MMKILDEIKRIERMERKVKKNKGGNKKEF